MQRLKAFWGALLVAAFFALPFPPAAGAEEKAQASLSLEEAITLALANNSEVKQAERNVELAKIQKEEVFKAYEAVLLKSYQAAQAMGLPEGTYLFVPGDPTPQVYQAQYNWELAQKNLEVKKESIARKVKEKYYAVLQAARNLEAAKLKKEEAARSLAAARARYEVGMETALSLSTYENQLASAEIALRDAEIKLAQAYTDFNLLIGLPAGERRELTSSPTFEALALTDPEAEITRIVNESPTVWMAERKLQLQRETYGMANSYEVDKLNLESAQASLNDTYTTLENALRSTYDSIKNLEATRASLLKAVENARQSYRLRELMYEVGLATKLEVLEAELTLKNLENQLFSLEAQHELAVEAFFKPWTASAASASAAASSAGS